MNIHQNLKPWWVNCFDNIMKNHEKYTEIKSVFHHFLANFFFHSKFEITLFRDIVWPKKDKKFTKIGPILKNFFFFFAGVPLRLEYSQMVYKSLTENPNLLSLIIIAVGLTNPQIIIQIIDKIKERQDCEVTLWNPLIQHPYY